MRSVPYHHRSCTCQTEPRNSCQQSSPAFSRAPLSQQYRTGTARAADDCLSEPKDETPEGSHWYYRIEHGTKRQCWYLREERERLSQTATPHSPPSAKSIAPKAEASTQGSIADAHAELWPQTRIEQPNRSVAPIPAVPADAAVGENGGGSGTPGAPTQRSTIASRWPDASETTPSINPTPNNDNPITSENSTSRTQPTSPLVAGPLAAADVPSQAPTYSAKCSWSRSWQRWRSRESLGSLIFKFGSARRSRRAQGPRSPRHDLGIDGRR